MSGIPVAYRFDTADFFDYYDELPQCFVCGWLPANYLTQTETSVLAVTYGGGWTSSDKHLSRYKNPSGLELIGTGIRDLCDDLMSLGWAIFFVHWPSGYNTITGSGWPQVYPACSGPEILIRMAKAVQMIKTWGYQGRTTNSTAHRTTWRTERIVCSGISAGSDNWGWALHQLAGAFPYESPNRLGYRRDHPMVPYFDHRAAAAILVDVFSDFRLADPNGLSANLLPLFGHNQWHDASPKVRQVHPDVLRAMSMLPYIEADLLPNRNFPLFVVNGGLDASGNMLGSSSTTKEQFLAAAAARVPIPGLNDPHSVGTALLIEEALKANLTPAGFAASKHRIYWGNETNNFDGRPAVPILTTQWDLQRDWIVNDLAIPAYT